MSKVKRTLLLINKEFQLKMIFISVILIGPVITLCYFSYSYFINSLVEKIALLDDSTRNSLISFIREEDQHMKTIILIGTLFIAIFNAMFFLILSHSIAGPIQKLQQHLIRKANNEITGPFATRKSDFFSELSKTVNDAFKD